MTDPDTGPKTPTGQGTDSKNSFLTQEWTESRSIVDKLDAQLSGLRQYGFSFITALLAGTSVLYQTSLSPTVKLAVILATFGMIEALHATDCYYRIIQSSAAHKARMLESQLGDTQGLTSVITEHYTETKGWTFTWMLYWLFLVATAVLGLAVLHSWSWQWYVVIAVAIVAGVAVYLLDEQASGLLRA